MKMIIVSGLIGMIALGGYQAQAAPPVNDNFADAINLPGESGNLSGNTTVDATFQAGEPTCFYPEAINTVWFKWTCATSGIWTISTAGSQNTSAGEWDSVVCIYTGVTLGTRTLFPVVKQDSGGAEIVSIPVSAGTTYYIQLAGDSGSPPQDAADITLTWSFAPVPVPVVVEIGNATTPDEPANPDAGVDINSVVGMGNIGRLVGLTQTHWASQGFWAPYLSLDLNGNSLIVDSGGGNVPFRAYGNISGTGDITFDTANDPNNPTPINIRGSNSYAGSTLLRRGLISLENPDGQNALLGDITVGGPAAGQAAFLVWTTAGNQISDSANVHVTANGSYLDLNGYPETFNTLTLPAGTKVKTGLGTNNFLRVNTLTLGSTAYTTGAFGADTPGGYVTGSGYILVGGTPPPVVTLPPEAPSSPVPADGATAVEPLYPTLSWADSLRATTYDLYFWLASDTKPATPTAAALTAAQYKQANILSDYASYKWQVVARNTAGPTNGPVWTFTTTSRTNISNDTTPWEPANPAAGVNIDYQVGLSNAGRLVGPTLTHWNSQGFNVPLNLNGNTLVVDSGGGNTPFHANGAISGTGAVTFDTVWNAPINIQGSNANTYVGPTLVRRGYVSLEKPDGQDALLGTITAGGTEAARLVWTANNQINDAADVILVQENGFANGSSLDLFGVTDKFHSLTMVTGTYVDTTLGGVLTVSSLIVDGVSQPAGTYDAGNSSFVLGSGSVVVVPAPAPPQFPVSGFSITNGVPTFVIPTVLGTQYRLVYKNSLTDTSWTAVGDGSWTPGTGNPLPLSDPGAKNPVVQPRRFYRLEAQ
ncbi:MAG: hypothetical protein NT154_26965 [Verrucomicrobia bacterium]|nr:hypothetical protein [Verrucomicrobiota bacterium]